MLRARRKGVTLLGSAHGDTGGASQATLTIDVSSLSIQLDDLLIAVMESGSSLWSGDTDWTEIFDEGSTPPGMRIAYKVAGASEGSSYTFTRATNGASTGRIVQVRNATYNTIGAKGTASLGTVITAPSITATKGLLLAFYVVADAATFTTPTNMSSVGTNSYTNGSYAVFSQAVAAGATGTKDSDPSGAGDGVGILVSLTET